MVDGGSIYTSADSGATWTERTSAGSRNWASIACSTDGTKLAAVVDGGYIYTLCRLWRHLDRAGHQRRQPQLVPITPKTDGTQLAAGVSAAPSTPLPTLALPGQSALAPVAATGGPLPPAQTAPSWRAVAYSGSIYTSTDSAPPGQRRTSAWQPLLAVHYPAQTAPNLAAVVNGGSIYTSTDSGATRTERTSAGSQSRQGITSSADGTKLAGRSKWRLHLHPHRLWRYLDRERTSAPVAATGGPATSSSDGTKPAVGRLRRLHLHQHRPGVTRTDRTSAGSRNWWSITLQLRRHETSCRSKWRLHPPPPTRAPPGQAHQRRQPLLAVRLPPAETALQAAAATAAPSTPPPTPAPPGQSAHQRRQSQLVLHYLSTDGTKLAAGVYGGSIYTSTDSGATWTSAPAPAAATGGPHYPAQTALSWRLLLTAVPSTPLPTPARPGQSAPAPQPHWYSITSSTDGTKLAAGVYGGSIYTSTDPAPPGQSAPAPAAAVGSPLPSTDGTDRRRVVRRLHLHQYRLSATWTERNQRRQPLLAVHYLSADGTKLAAGVNGGKSTPYTMASQLTVTG